MQAALDSTSLAMAKLAPTLTAAQLQTQANAYFQALFNSPGARNVTITTACASGAHAIGVSEHRQVQRKRVVGDARQRLA